MQFINDLSQEVDIPDQSNFNILGGPVIAEETDAFEGSVRFVLMGTVHGAFADCSNGIPGIFVETDDVSVLNFLYKEAYGSGMLKFKKVCMKHFHSIQITILRIHNPLVKI